MKRIIDEYLKDWKKSSIRKPLILRGARQVGKTYACRQLGLTFKSFVEVNFEKSKNARDIFNHELDPKSLLINLSLLTNQEIKPGETLLFLDEIQEQPLAITALRYFYEEMPNLHIIAAGSLIEFCLEAVGMPVGRVQFLHVYPMSFFEYMVAKERTDLLNLLIEHNSVQKVSDTAHQLCHNYLMEYFSIGGMPDVVKSWIEHNNPNIVSEIQHNIINSYKLDFPKYSKSHQLNYISLVFEQAPIYIGKKFKYSNISSEHRSRELSPCLDLLVTADLIHKIYHTTGAGIPLGAEINHKFFKIIMLDIGLNQTLMEINFSDWLLNPETTLINKGEIAEAFVGQELLAYSDLRYKKELYYWQRESKNSQAELDYLIDINGRIIPIEVKSGQSKRLISLNMFMEEKGLELGIHFSPQNFLTKGNIQRMPIYSVLKFMKNNMMLKLLE